MAWDVPRREPPAAHGPVAQSTAAPGGPGGASRDRTLSRSRKSPGETAGCASEPLPPQARAVASSTISRIIPVYERPDCRAAIANSADDESHGFGLPSITKIFPSDVTRMSIRP